MDRINLASLVLKCKETLEKCSEGRLGHLLKDQRGSFDIIANSRQSLENQLRKAPYVEMLAREVLTNTYQTLTQRTVHAQQTRS